MNPQAATGFVLTTLDWIVGMSAIIGSILFGGYMARRIGAGKDSAHFFLAGRSLPWWIVGLSLYATNIGAEHLVGLTGDAYRYGLSAGTVELTTAMCLGFGAAVLFPYYFKNRVFTIPEFLEIRYNTSARVCFSGLMLVICVMTKMAFCLFAGALVIKQILNLDVMHTVVALGVITAIFTMIGGFAAVAYADIIQSVIKILGCTLMLGFGLYYAGGWNGLVEGINHIDPQMIHIHKPYTDADYPFWGIILGAIYGGVFYWGVDQVNVQRVLGARDLKHARWGAMLCVLLKFTPVFIFALPGVVLHALAAKHPEWQPVNPKETFVALMNHMLPTGVRGLVLAALVCALISALDATMNSVSTLVVRDFVLRLRPRTSERQQVFIGRIAIAVSTALGIGAAYLVYKNQEGLYKYLQTISIYLVMPITPAIIFGILSKRVNMTGAVASVLVGMVAAAFFVSDQMMNMLGGRVGGVPLGTRTLPFLHHVLTENYTYRGFWGTVLVTLTLFAVSWMTKPTAPEKLATTTIDWGSHHERIEGLRDWRLQLAVLCVTTIGLYWWLW